MSRHERELLFRAVDCLIGTKSLRRRLTQAAVPLMQLNESDLPVECRPSLGVIKDILYRTPLELAGYQMPREITNREAKLAADEIFGLFIRVMGGL